MAVICLALLLACCLLLLAPFVSALLWAIVLSFSLWPFNLRLVGWFRGRRTLASLAIAGGLGLLILLPLLVVGLKAADNVQDFKTATQRWLEAPPPPPTWLGKVPVVGAKAVASWQELASDNSKLREKAKEAIEPVSLWLLKAGLALGRGLLQLALSMLITFFLLRDGATVAEQLGSGIRRIAGTRGERLLTIAGKTVRGVVYGVVGTALIQGALAAIGFLIAGVPNVLLLGLLTFVLCIVPLGAPLIFIPAIIWLVHGGESGWAIFLSIWGLGVSTVDNFIKPVLISQGSDMPFLLVLFGALGGLAVFGFIGLFIGPTLLAVAYNLVDEWLSEKRNNSPQPEPEPEPEPA